MVSQARQKFAALVVDGVGRTMGGCVSTPQAPAAGGGAAGPLQQGAYGGGGGRPFRPPPAPSAAYAPAPVQQAYNGGGAPAFVGVGGTSQGPSQEALFFPDPRMPCYHFMRGRRCPRGNGCQYAHHPTSLSRLVAVLDGTRAQLDVCVFTITCKEISEAIVAAHQRGVRVRVITDDEMEDNRGSKTGALKSRGIPVRNDHDHAYMHHKFALVDRRTLVNGSFK